MEIFFIFIKICIALLCIFLLSISLTWFIYEQAIKRKWLSKPNERSSHAEPTPSIGGISIAALFLIAVSFLGLVEMIDRNLMFTLLGGGLLLAVVGIEDERNPIKARYRLLAQAIAAGWALWWLGGIPNLHLGFTVLPWGVFGSAVAFIAMIALCNFYNFMDGIDGLVGSETIYVSIVMGAIFALFGHWGLAIVLWVLTASTAGFLFWNWHPAKLFMGDVGSVLIGFSFGTIAIFGENKQILPVFIWAIPLSVVLVDAGASTIIRAVRGKRWFEAHRTFGYHAACERGLTHSQVVVAVAGINLFLIAPIVLVFWKAELLVPVVLIVLLSLTFLWRRIHKSAFS